MRAIEFEGYNLLLNPPANSERGSCGALPVFRYPDRLCSVWKPDADELAALVDGAHICLSILGQSHPPVMLHVQKFEEMP